MSKFRTLYVALVLSVAAVVVAGCGSSSSSKSKSTPAAASTPATPSTPSTPTSVNPNHVPASTPIASPAYHNALEQAFLKAGASPSGAKAGADCIVKEFGAAGAKTQGDIKKVGTQKGAAILSTCAQQAKSH